MSGTFIHYNVTISRKEFFGKLFSTQQMSMHWSCSASLAFAQKTQIHTNVGGF